LRLLIEVHAMTTMKSPHYDKPPIMPVSDVARDIRYGFRRLRGKPAFALTVILTLGLSIGVNVAVFSLVNALLVKGLPYRNAQRLVLLSNLPIGEFMQSQGAFEKWKSESDLIEDAVLCAPGSATFLGGSEPRQLPVANVTSNLFEVLGVAPRAGRLFLPEDGHEGRTKVAVISERLWRSQFSASNSTFGQGIKFNGEMYTVVGVAPAGCDFPAGVEVWTPTAYDFVALGMSHAVFSTTLGLIKPGATVAQVDAQQRSWLQGRHLDQSPDPAAGQSIPIARALRSALTAKLGNHVLLLFAGVILVLLIGCANVMSLVLVDSGLREHEFSVRRAVGMSTRQLVRQLFVEHLLIGVLGGSAGVAMAYLSLPYLRTYIPKDWPGFADISIDGRVLAFGLGVSIFAGLAVGLAPCVRFSRRRYSLAPQPGTRATETRAGRLGRESIVCAETALAMVLLVATALFIQTLKNLVNTDCGFRPDNVLAATVLRDAAHPDADSRSLSFYKQALDKLSSLPGVDRAGGVDYLPARQDLVITTQARPDAAEVGAVPVPATLSVATPGYFATVGIPMLGGRDFNEFDDAAHPAVAIVDRNLADKLWPAGVDPIGRKISIENGPTMAVIGVVGPIRVFGPTDDIWAGLYRPLAQSIPNQLSFVVHSSGPVKPLLSKLGLTLRGLDADQPVEIATLEGFVEHWSQDKRSITFLLTVLSGLALALVIVGMYGLVSYSIASRTKEFGIRMALGETSRRIMFRSVSGAARAITPGIGLGVVLCFVVGGFFEAELYGIHAANAATVAAIALLLITVAVLASFLAARRSLLLDPINVLRQE
jgi:putative ABC transport system permease protein